MQSSFVDWSKEWLKFKEGDLNAFQTIYDGFLPNLYAYGVKLAPGFGLLDDCIQELFLDLYTHRKNLKTPENLEFYLLKSLRYIIFHKIKKESRYTNIEEKLTKSFLFSLESDDYESDNFIQNKIELIRSALSELNSTQREILYLKFYNNMNYNEIGTILGVKPESAKKQVYRVVERLREDLTVHFLNLFHLCFKA